MAYFVNVATLVAIFTVLGVSLNWLLGYAGMFSIAHGAFFGIGAYTFAILMADHRWPLVPAFAAAVVISGILGGLLGTTAIRISGEFLIIASFGVQEMASSVFTNWNSVTGGVNGVILPGLFAFFGMTPNVGALTATGVLAVAALAASWRVARSRRGRVGRWLRALRSDEIAYVACGRSSGYLKVLVHVVSFASVGLIGAVYADFLRFVAPNDFDLNTSVLVLTVVAIGGAAHWFGPFLGALVAVGLPQLLTFTPLPSNDSIPIEQIFYGVALVLFMIFRPNGLLNRDYRPTPVTRGGAAGDQGAPGSAAGSADPLLARPADDPKPGPRGWSRDVLRAAREFAGWMSSGRSASP